MSVFRVFLLLLFFIGGRNAHAREVELSWDPFDNTLGYHIYVSKSADFKDIVVKKATKEPAISVNLEIGTYFYKVRAVDKDKQPGHWSEPMKFSVTPYPPELKSPKNDVEYSYFEIPPNVEFEWKPVDDNPEYELFVYKTTGKKVFEGKFKDLKASIHTLEEGEYMWKLRTIYKGIYESPYGEPRRFTIEKKDIQKPNLVTPAQDSAVPAYHSILLEWQKDPISKFSDIDLNYVDSETGKKSKIEVPQNLSETEKYELPFAEPGEYTWTVKTKEGEKTKGLLSEPGHFTARKDLISADNFSFYYGLGLQSLSQSYTSTYYPGYETGESTSTSWSNNVGGSYYLSEGYGLQLDMSLAKHHQADSDVPHQTWTFANHFRFGTPGFNQHFIFGYRQMNVYEVTTAPVADYQLYTSNGLVIGTQFNGSVGSKYKILVEGLYYKPLSTSEAKAKFTGDVYEGTLGFSWNPAYKFWIGYEFRYQKGVYQVVPGNNPDSVYNKWDTTVLTPILIKLSFEN